MHTKAYTTTTKRHTGDEKPRSPTPDSPMLVNSEPATAPSSILILALETTYGAEYRQKRPTSNNGNANTNPTHKACKTHVYLCLFRRSSWGRTTFAILALLARTPFRPLVLQSVCKMVTKSKIRLQRKVISKNKRGHTEGEERGSALAHSSLQSSSMPLSSSLAHSEPGTRTSSSPTLPSSTTPVTARLAQTP